MGSQLRWTSTASSAYGGGDQWDFAIHNQLISPTTEVLLEQCQGTVCETIVTSLDTSILVPSFSEDSTGLAAPPTTSPPAATAASATAGEFSVDCSFDSGLRRIWCEASGGSNSAQITWGAGSQWGAAGRTFEYLLTEDWQLIPETLVTVENCGGSNCLTVEIAVDTSSVALPALEVSQGSVSSDSDQVVPATIADLTINCAFDDPERRISCEAIGYQDSTRLRWTTNVDSGVGGGITKEYVFDWGANFDELVVQLEECHDPDGVDFFDWADCSAVTWTETVDLQPRGECRVNRGEFFRMKRLI